MKLRVSPWLLGPCAAAAAVVRAGSCVPGLVRETNPPSSSATTIQFRAACGAKLDMSGPYGVFAGPANGSVVGAYIRGVGRNGDAVTVHRDLVAGESTVLVTATDEEGRTLLESFDLHDDATEADSTTTIYEQRAADDDAATCTTCNAPGILCQPSCQNPPQTCDFYSSCAEAAVPCGASGYALGYGLANCRKFVQRQARFSAAGRAWILRVMACLQRFLVAGPLTRQCGLTCDALRTAAFGSHPACYVDSGVCALPAADWVQLVLTIGVRDVLMLDTLRQAVATGGQCLGRWTEELEGEIARLTAEGLRGGEEDRVRVAAEMAVLETVKGIFE